MSSSNCCFLTCIQVPQEAGQVVWYTHLFQNFPQFIVSHTVKGFGIVNKTEIDFFWNFLALSMIQKMLAIWSLVPLPFLKPAWWSGSLQFMYCWSMAWRILSITLLACAEKAMAYSSTLAWKIPWMEQPGRLQSMGSLRVGHDWETSLSLFTFTHWRRKW